MPTRTVAFSAQASPFNAHLTQTNFSAQVSLFNAHCLPRVIADPQVGGVREAPARGPGPPPEAHPH